MSNANPGFGAVVHHLIISSYTRWVWMQTLLFKKDLSKKNNDKMSVFWSIKIHWSLDKKSANQAKLPVNQKVSQVASAENNYWKLATEQRY
jgi:predicted NAD/FAD-dependent oxidoreductase